MGEEVIPSVTIDTKLTAIQAPIPPCLLNPRWVEYMDGKGG